MNESAKPQPVVVGIDGSKAAIRAALWAVDEAVSRDVPLRLLHAIEQADGGEGGPATAETALRQARTAIEATGKPVKIESEVANGPAVASLIRASASAAMVCVGAVGLRHFRSGRVGSTAAALAVSARCPVAIIRGRDDHVRRPADHIVVEVDESPDNGALLRAAIDEAQLRNAAVRAVVCRRNEPGEPTVADTESNRRALADLDRRLAPWKRRYPQLRVESVAVHGSLLEYVAYNRRAVGLVIVGSRNRQHVSELVGPVGSAILQDADCSLLIANRQHL
ncbi:MAG: universal stress protein [Mycobacterium sp.]|uniref:universal stress protein n=1 Tax=Mycobacterium sp. TaxID=1785 RepID=UPI003F9D3FAE